jgi:adenylate cyclase
MQSSSNASVSLDVATREARTLLISFVDLTRFTAFCQKRDDATVADFLDDLYERVGRHVHGAGGRVVKFIGDATLIVFDGADCDVGVRALLALRREVDGHMADQGLPGRLIVKAHLGQVVWGPVGIEGDKRLDCIGSAVNTAATLGSQGLALSVQAFRGLEPETRRLFKKHTPPITYIPSGDRRPS